MYEFNKRISFFVQHEVKGQCPYAFVTLVDGRRLTHELIAEMKKLVREKIGAVSFTKF